MIVADPMLEGVGAVLLDEFHERSLDADAALAFTLDARSGLREDLRLVVMSATIDGARVAALIGSAPVIEAEGRLFPIETRYAGRPDGRRLEDAMADAIERATRGAAGSVLAFLPGQAEIARTADRLGSRLDASTFDVVALHGGLDARAQRQAIEPAAAGRRKVVLATSIAQTSLTLADVRIVVDCGLERVPRFDPGAGLTRLVTVPVSRATADQRRGRAGRTAPGVAWRLWDEPQTAGLKPYPDPEIHAADLSGLLLDCAAWGMPDPTRLAWLDPPTAGAVAAARTHLATLGAIADDGRLTPLGTRLRSLPLPPRLARMLVGAADLGRANEAAEIAAVIVERAGGRDVDLERRITGLRADRSERGRALRRLAEGWARAAQSRSGAGGAALPAGAEPEQVDAVERAPAAALLAFAYPERIAKARGSAGQYLLVGGQGAVLDPVEPLAQAPWIVVADLAGTAAQARVVLATALPGDAVLPIAKLAGVAVTVDEETTFDPASAALRARRTTRLGAVVLQSEPRSAARNPANARLLAQGIARLGIFRLPWTDAQLQLRARVAFLARTDSSSDAWPDLDDAPLAATAADWLAPYIEGRLGLADIGPGELATALEALLPWSSRARLESEAPATFVAPTGRRHPIDWESEQAPRVAIKVQELYGLGQHPTVAGGRLPLTLALLSPAGREVQITRNLPAFWKGVWQDVRAEMRGRYPRHDWPLDPLAAMPATGAKRRRD
jgi:ATP-dependent helicase HrpB